MSERRLCGVIPILAMPFDAAGDVDLEGLRREVDFLIDSGVEALGFGFASEAFRLTGAEQEAAIRAVVARVGGRRPVVVHAPASSVVVAVEKARWASSLGADILMVPAPSLVQAPEEDLFRYFGAVAAATRLPIVVQDAPGMTGTAMSVELLARLLTEVDGVVALKIETVPPAPKIAAVAAAVNGQPGVLGGAGGVDFFHELDRGASGTMPGAGIPELFRDVWRLHGEGHRRESGALFNRYLPLLVLGQRSLDTFLWLQKEILRRRGVLPEAALRAPSERLEAGLSRDLDALLDELLPYGLPS